MTSTAVVQLAQDRLRRVLVRLAPRLERCAKSRESPLPTAADFSCVQVNSWDRARSNAVTRYELKSTRNIKKSRVYPDGTF
jgi:hypothetical protein